MMRLLLSWSCRLSCCPGTASRGLRHRGVSGSLHCDADATQQVRFHYFNNNLAFTEVHINLHPLVSGFRAASAAAIYHQIWGSSRQNSSPKGTTAQEQLAGPGWHKNISQHTLPGSGTTAKTGRTFTTPQVVADIWRIYFTGKYQVGP
jgi:hypothetical protein